MISIIKKLWEHRGSSIDHVQGQWEGLSGKPLEGRSQKMRRIMAGRHGERTIQADRMTWGSGMSEVWKGSSLVGMLCEWWVVRLVEEAGPRYSGAFCVGQKAGFFSLSHKKPLNDFLIKFTFWRDHSGNFGRWG